MKVMMASAASGVPSWGMEMRQKNRPGIGAINRRLGEHAHYRRRGG
jgi:hypothetical protein